MVRQDRVIILAKYVVGGIESCDQQKPGGRGVEGQQKEIGAVDLKNALELPHIARPGSRSPDAFRLRSMVGENIVDHYEPVRWHQTLGMHEIAQRAFEMVHSVDEYQLRRAAQRL